MERQEILNRLERVLKWYESQSRTTDNHYLEVKNKYEYILNGGQYQVTDRTEELKNMIAFVGGQIPTVNFKSGNKLINKPGITWEQAKKRVEKFNLEITNNKYKNI